MLSRQHGGIDQASRTTLAWMCTPHHAVLTKEGTWVAPEAGAGTYGPQPLHAPCRVSRAIPSSPWSKPPQSEANPAPAEGEFWGVDNVELQLIRLLPDRFDVEGSVAIPGSTGPGSGNLELPRSEDHYQLTIDSTTKGLYVDRLACMTNQRFIVVDADGDTITDQSSIGVS